MTKAEADRAYEKAMSKAGAQGIPLIQVDGWKGKRSYRRSIFGLACIAISSAIASTRPCKQEG